MAPPQVQTYLFFNGQCEEALEFYKSAIGAKIEFTMHYRDSPEPMPGVSMRPNFEGKVMHATVRIGGTTLMAADDCVSERSFDGFSLSLALPTEADAHRAFDALSDGGRVTMPLTKTFWSPCFGMLTDKFGVGWMVTMAAQT